MSRPQPGLLALVSPNSTVLKSNFPFKKEEKIQELMEEGGWHPNSSNADLLNYRSLFIEVPTSISVYVGQGLSRILPSPALASAGPGPQPMCSHPALWPLPG